MTGGYMGKILHVDLTTGKIEEKKLTEELCRDYIGGYGFGVKYLYENMRPKTDALGPDNILGFMTGPLTGTPAPTGNRYTVFAKSPLTGGWGDANSGGDFGPHLKFAGFDGVIFTGQAKKPVYLLINEGKAELKPADSLWGRDTFDVDDSLKAEHGKEAEVACIGPAGEKQSLISCIMNNKGRAAGRSGLGAVMGSKKLKAIVVKGKIEVPVVNAEKANELRRTIVSQPTGTMQWFKAAGTPGTTVSSALGGDSPVKNWSGAGFTDFPNAKELGADKIGERMARRYGCWHCPIACGGIMKESTGEFDYGKASHRPEYETLSMFGSNCLNSNLDSILKVNDDCNRYGIDTISTGAAVSFAIDCYEHGILTKADTDGLEMKWGNYKAIVALNEKICKREGLGAVLADGVKRAAEKIGKGSEKYAIHVGGQEVPAHDPKFNLSYPTTYLMDATPARHTQGGTGSNPPGLLPDFDRKSFSGRAEAHRVGANMLHIINAIGMCEFMYNSLPNADNVAEFVNYITGWKVTTADLLKAGERIGTLRHEFNLREGLNPLKVHAADRLFGKEPLQVGPLKDVKVDTDIMVKEYMQLMDWDLVTAKPSAKALKELRLDTLVEN